jgi:glycosyltransferase involved in cell wall biosynthesis
VNKKKVAFIFAQPIRTDPILITMPFGLNVITLLVKKGYNVDVYLSEYRNDSYTKLFPKNVSFKFIDQNLLWRNNVSLAYFLVTTYFKLFSFFKAKNSYNLIFGSGMAGVKLGSILKKYNPRSKFVYLNDEFPIQASSTGIWIKGEIEAAITSDFVSTPDESRFAPLCKQIKGLDKKPHFTLPNAPLIDEMDNIPSINWHEHYKIPSDKKLFLVAGGMSEVNQLSELLSSVKNWPENTLVILKGKHDIENVKKLYASINIPEKIIWCGENFSPEKLHSLIKYSTASICLYQDINDNFRFVGKSAGKLMRSILLGKPVIVSKYNSLDFVEELGIGKIVKHPNEIPLAVEYIIKNEEQLISNCKNNYHKISYEKYWEKFIDNLIF